MAAVPQHFDPTPWQPYVALAKRHDAILEHFFLDTCLTAFLRQEEYDPSISPQVARLIGGEIVMQLIHAQARFYEVAVFPPCTSPLSAWEVSSQMAHVAAILADWKRVATFLQGYNNAELELGSEQVTAIFGVIMAELKEKPLKALEAFRA